MTSTEVIPPESTASLMVEPSLSNQQDATPPRLSSPDGNANNEDSTTVKKEESSSPLSNTSPNDAPTSTNPSSPRDAKPEISEASEKTERNDPQNVAKPKGKGKKSRHIVLYNELADKTDEATSTFALMEQCTYTPKSLANSGQEEELMSCECRPEYENGVNHACSHNCINAETFVECVDGDSNCGGQCQNQKFQKREYADVSVIQTEMKGYGLRANVAMEPGTFIYEYIGEVINESQFRRRREQYGKEDIKHFYFMSIKVGEYIDATKRGCLARFCNHSCNPNSMVEKWVVGGKLRMGIFAKVKIEAGEELTFDYNVDRYGADPQKCFCGEPNCIGYIGGKTQTESSTKLPTLYLEALGLDDDDGWQTATAKKSRKKKDDDDDYVTTTKARQLSHEGVPKVMGTLMQASKRWIVIKLLDRIEASPDPKVLPRVLEMHGYKIFSKLLGEWKTEFDIVIPILNIMQKWPRITKNKISSSKIESTVKDIAETSENAEAKELAEDLAKAWSALEMGYRIPRRQKDSNDSPNPDFDRRSWRRSRSRSRSPERAEPINIPTGPRLSKPPPIRNHSFPKNAPKGPKSHRNPLPKGWKVSTAESGKSYYYNENTKATQWHHPGSQTPSTPQPAVPSIKSQRNDEITNIIKTLEREALEAQQAHRLAATRKQLSPIPTEEKEEDKTKKLIHHERRVKLAYYSIVKDVTAEYVQKMGKPEIKKRNEEITRLCAQKDMKKYGLKTPIQIDSEKTRQIKKFTQTYMRSLWKKMKVHYASKKAKEPSNSELSAKDMDADVEIDAEISMIKDDVILSVERSPLPGSLSPKRKRSESEDAEIEVNGRISPKRSRVNETVVLSTIPPPPPGTPPPESASPSPNSPKRKREDGDYASTTPATLEESSSERPSKRPRSLSKSRSPSPHSNTDHTLQATA